MFSHATRVVVFYLMIAVIHRTLAETSKDNLLTDDGMIQLPNGTLITGFTLEQGIPHFNTKPYFLPPIFANASSLGGQSAYLHCRVAQLGDKKVSWIRRRDLHVLTSGMITFASDERFQALHQDRSENWTLHIRFSQVQDSGEYQCQVNTEPRITMSFYLQVTDASTKISGSVQRYIKVGSTIKLSCSTNVPSPPPGLLYWYRDADLLEESSRVSIQTNFGKTVTSTLEIETVSNSDSGNFTCWPTKFRPSSVTIHVITDEKPAAMSHGTLGNTRTETSKSTPSNPLISGDLPSITSQGSSTTRATNFGNSIRTTVWKFTISHSFIQILYAMRCR